MKKQLICILFLLIITKLYSQKDYRPGIVILNSGDSISGLLDFRSNFSNSQHLYFKNDTNSNVIEYFPNQLKAYYFINSKYYVSKNIKLNEQERRVFLEFLFLGKVNLFYVAIKDNDAHNVNMTYKEHFFVEKDSQLYEINNEIITITDSTGKKFVRNSNQYRGALKYFFSDCPDIYKELDHVEFNQKALINVSKNYHEKMCPNEQCIIFEKTISKRKYSFGVEYNLIFPKIDFYSLQTKVLSNVPANEKYSLGVMGAISMDYDYRFWFQTNIKYQHQSYHESGIFSTVYPVEFVYEFNSIMVDPSIKYYMLLTKVKPFVMGGLVVGYILNEQYQINTTLNTTPTYADNNNLIYGLKAAGGVEYNVSSKLKIYVSIDYSGYLAISKMMVHGFSLNTGISFLL